MFRRRLEERLDYVLRDGAALEQTVGEGIELVLKQHPHLSGGTDRGGPLPMAGNVLQAIRDE